MKRYGVSIVTRKGKCVKIKSRNYKYEVIIVEREEIERIKTELYAIKKLKPLKTNFKEHTYMVPKDDKLAYLRSDIDAIKERMEYLADMAACFSKIQNIQDVYGGIYDQSLIEQTDFSGINKLISKYEKVIKSQKQEISNQEKGDEAEANVFLYLRDNIPNTALFTNIFLPSHQDSDHDTEIDALLLTTNGVFVIEVKNRGTQSGTRYEYDIDGNERKIVNGTSYQSGETEETPVQQLRREKRAVEYFLKQNLVNDVPVIPIMVNANPNVTYFSENEIVMCNGVRNLKKQIYNCCSNILISKEDFSFIGEKLFEVQNKIIKKYVPITLYCIDDNKAYIYQDDETENRNIMTEELKNAIVYYNSEALEDKIKIKEKQYIQQKNLDVNDEEDDISTGAAILFIIVVTLIALCFFIFVVPRIFSV